MRHGLMFLLAAMLAAGGALARPLLSVTKYGEDDGLPGWHVTQVAQDHRGIAGGRHRAGQGLGQHLV